MARTLDSGMLFGLAGMAGCAMVPASEPRSPRPVSDVAPNSTRRFIESLSGKAIIPGDAEYDASRRVWNAAYDKHPGLIVFCADQADVVRAVEFCRQQEVLMSVRSGGHSLAGKSTCDGGVVLDLSRLKKIDIDPATRVARVQAGLQLGELDAATAERNLATTAGTDPSTGIAGLTLGGGLGWLMGKHGLACDNLRSVDIVLADGRAVTASPRVNEELFWAVRGAGANFGIVTAFEYDLYPVSTILAGVIKYPPEMMAEVLRHYRDFSEAMPDEVGLSVGTLPSRQGKPMVTLAVSHCGGDLVAAERVLRPLRRLAPALSDDIRPVPYRDFQRRGGMPPGLRLSSFTRSSFLHRLDDAAIEAITAQAGAVPPMAGNVVIERFHGRAARVSSTATAFPHRAAGHNFSLHGTWTQPAGEAPAMQWATAFWQAMQPFVSAAVYSNYLDNEGGARARASYGENFERLAALKRRFDPTNFFSANQNIATMA